MKSDQSVNLPSVKFVGSAVSNLDDDVIYFFRSLFDVDRRVDV